MQLDYSDEVVTATLVLACPRPAAESAHNKTLQLPCLGLPGRSSSKLNHWTANQPTARQSAAMKKTSSKKNVTIDAEIR